MTEYTNEELVCRAQNGDQSAKELLYSRNARFIKSMALEAYKLCQSPKGIDFDDMFQEAGIAFLLSVNEFDIYSGYSFLTYSGTCIKNRVRNYLITESDRNGKTQPLEYVTADNYEVNLLNEDLPYVTDYRSQKSLSAEDEYFKKFKNEQLTKAYNLLNPRQQKYISYRFGLGEYDNPHSRNNAAEYFGLTYEKATELERESLEVMRGYYSGEKMYFPS